MKTRNRKELLREIDELRTRLEETEETLRAIHAGEKGEQIYTLQGEDHSYRVLMETMNEGAATLTGDGTILHGNGRLASLLKKSLHDLIGSFLPQFVAPAASRTFTKLLKQGRKGHSSGEIALQCADGTSVPVQISMSPVDMGGTKVMCLVAMDLTDLKQAEETLRHADDFVEERIRERTAKLSRANAALRTEIRERRKAEEALRESEARERQRAEELGAVLEAVPAAVWIAHNPDCRSITGNRAANELLRLPRGGEASLTAPADARPTHFKAVKNGREMRGDELPLQIAARGITTHNIEHDLVFDDGTIRHILGNATPLSDERGRPRGSVAAFIDITERKQMEEELSRTHELLEAVTRGTEVIIAAQDTNFHYTYFNKMYEEEIKRLTGRDIHIGASMVELFADMPEQQKIAVREWSRVLQGESFSQRIEFGDPGRYRRVYSVHHTPVRNVNGLVVGAGEVAYDITKQVQVEDALRRSEAMLAEAQRIANVGSWEWDVQSGVVLWSDQMFRIFGEERGSFAPTYDDFLALVHPDDRPRTADAIRDSLARGSRHVVEYRVLTRQGETRVVLAQAEVMLEREGRSRRVVGTAMDITERKKREEELHRLNLTLKAKSHSDQAMMRATDESEYMDEVCKIVVEDCGYAMVWIGFAEKDEARTVRPVASAGFEEGYLETLNITWADTERGRGPTGTAIRTGKFSMCKNMLTDSRFAPWREEALKRGYASSLVLPLMADGKAFGAITIYSRESDSFSEDEVKLLSELSDDLAYGIAAIRLRATHAKATAEAEEGKRILDALMEYIPEGITIADASDIKIRMVSLYGRDMLGEHEGMKMENVAEQWKVYRSDGVTPITIEDLPLARAIRKGEILKNEEIVQINAEGKPLNLLCNAAPLYDGGGHIMGGIVAWRDITEIKLAQQEVRRAARELARSNQDLEQFAYVASHDLKEPLRMVRGFMGLLKSQYQGALDVKANEYISFATDAAARMQDLIDALLAYSRVGRGGATESVPVPDVVDAALKNLRASIDESGAVITRDSLPTLQMNPVELTQVFQNLIGNAIKFRQEGVALEVHIGAERMSGVRGQGSGVRSQGSGVRGQETGSLKSEAIGPADMAETGIAWQPVAARPPLPDTRNLNSDTWLFSVRDNGIGIEPQFTEKIFMIFQRLHTREEYPGSGVGLAICKKIVERHGGRIWVDSQPGRGSTFYFSIQDNGKDMK